MDESRKSLERMTEAEAEEREFDDYLERELLKLAEDAKPAQSAPSSPRPPVPETRSEVPQEMKESNETKSDEASKESQPTPTSTSTSPRAATPTISLSAFPPKPRPALLVSVPPSPPSKETRTASPAPAPAAPPLGSPPKYQPPKLKPIATRPNPLRVNVGTGRRPMTAMTTMTTMTTMTAMTGSTRRLSFSSTSTTRRQIKYGKGKYARVELVPQPSDDDDDPLNWPRWKKEVNFWALLLTVALIGVMKTVFVTVNSQLAMGYAVSYTAAAALTGVPLMISALTGFVSLVAARVWGKRPLYLASLVLIFWGAVWNTHVVDSFAQCMVARVFQGLGWGAFDSLILGSIHDTYFEHERNLRIAIYDVVVVGTTWGGPLIGGAVSANAIGFSLQFWILDCFLAVAVLAVVLGAPETVYDRSSYSLNTPVSAWSNKELPLRPRMTLSLETVKDYVCHRGLRPRSYHHRHRVDLTLLLQAPRAMAAPTTVLLTLVSFLPYCALWGMVSSLSLLFSPLPFVRSTGGVGAVMTAPFLLATGVVAAFGLWLAAPWQQPAQKQQRMAGWQSRLRFFDPLVNAAAVGAGSLLVFIGLLAFGLYTASCMTTTADEDAAAHVSAFTVNGRVGSKLAFPAVSFVLGLLAAGAYVLDATVRPMVRRSTQFTSSNLCVAQRNTVDMCAGVALWRTLLAGAFVMALPNAVWFWELLKATSVGIVVAQVLVATVVAAAWWRYDETIRRLDGQVMRCVDLGMLKQTGSFFDTD